MSHTDRPSDGGSALRRRTVIAISGVAAVAAGVGSCLAIVAGGSPASSLSADSVAFHQASGPSDAPSTALTIPADYTQPIGRNPFKPLVVPPPPAAPSHPAPSSAPTSSAPAIPMISILPAPTVTVTVTAAPSSAKPATPTPSHPASPSPPTALPTAGQAITLTLVSVDAAKGTANVTVAVGNTTTPFNDLKPGDPPFGTYFKLVSILSDPSTTPASLGAGFQYGDQFVQLNQGESAQLG